MDLSFIIFAFSSCCLLNFSGGGVLPPLEVIYCICILRSFSFVVYLYLCRNLFSLVV